MSKHTQGQWKANHDGAFIYAEDPTLGTVVICSTERASDNDYTPTYSTVNESERVANECLIADAPKTAVERDRLRESNACLLAVLKKVQRLFQSPAFIGVISSASVSDVQCLGTAHVYADVVESIRKAEEETDAE